LVWLDTLIYMTKIMLEIAETVDIE
jgi:hypothetical protein